MMFHQGLIDQTRNAIVKLLTSDWMLSDTDASGGKQYFWNSIHWDKQ